ncbi:MAG: ABC transporter permease subunit [Candidatus Promineifilaceae bacterium]|jgi:peptide/nickel transport system permease protein
MEQVFDKPAPKPDAPESPADSTSGVSQASLYRDLLIFIGRRLLFGTVVLLAIIFLAYFAFSAAQTGDIFGSIGHAVSDTANYIGGVLQGDLGLSQPRSAAYRPQPILEILPEALKRSLGLIGITFLLSIVLGVPLGIWAAVRRHGKGALAILVVSFIGISTPVFFLALFLQIAAIEYTQTFGQSIVSVGGFGWDKHLVLPVLVLVARPIAQITRITFVTISDQMDEDYVRTARGKGLRSNQVLLGHILKNAAIPILTTIAISLRFVLSSLLVVETYFGWNGMGEVLLRAMFNGDTNLTIALLSCLGIVFIIVNLVLDLSYYALDPRIQPGSAGSTRSGQGSISSSLKQIPIDLVTALKDNPVTRWFERRRSPVEEEPSPFKEILEEQGIEDIGEMPTGERRRKWAAWRYGVLGNVPFIAGALIVGTLIYLLFLGPRIAPFSPNTTQQIAIIDGEIAVPPFAPSQRHPWGTDAIGRDIQSLILAGVQQTLILAFAVVLIRMSIGFILGVLAGWFNDSWLDQFIRAVVSALAVFPTLLLAAFFIFAIGFQGGIRTFLIALFLVGWGEIVEFVRAEVISLRTKPFIESAIAVGQSTPRLIRVHFLPNLAPGLISVAAVEVAAVLLLLGELGFIGVFIQGGATTDFGLYSQVPEWGSLLAGVRTWVRSYPWTGIYPVLAFFIAILGFNLLGEGLRRLLGRFGIIVNSLFNKYVLIAFAAILISAFFWLRQNTGELVFYRQQADTFEASNALTHIEDLTNPVMQGRALGSPGLDEAAAYIRDEFDSLGLQPAGENITFYQAENRTYQLQDEPPSLSVDDGGAEVEYRQEYMVYPKATLNVGQAEGEVRMLTWSLGGSPPDVDLTGDIVLLLSGDDLDQLAAFSCQGVLVTADDLGEMKQRYTLSAQSPGAGCGQDTPVLWISDHLGNRLLEGNGWSIPSLITEREEFDEDEFLDIDTDVQVSIDIPGEVVVDDSVVNIIGHMPGTSDAMDDQLVIVAAQYDSPPLGPDGPYPNANSSASGVAVMMEAIRTMQESGYQPYRTFLFVAYSGEGMPDLSGSPDVQRFLEARTGFADNFNIEGVVYVRGIGAGGEDLSTWSPEKSDLAKLIETAAHLTGSDTERIEGPADMNVFVPGGVESQEGAYPVVGLSRQGWYRTANQPNDTLTFISPDTVDQAGRALTLGLMILGREGSY